MSFSLLIENQIAIIHFDCGTVNAFSSQDIHELDVLLSHCESLYPKVRMVRLMSNKISPKGYHVFCAGADQKERAVWSIQEILDHLAYQRSVVHRFRSTPLLMVSCVDGLALGLGAEICLASDFVMASPNSSFGFPEKNWGIIPGAGGYAWAHGWAEHPEAAQKLICTGERFDCEYATWLGIVDISCDSEDFKLESSYLFELFCSEDPAEQILKKKLYHEKIDYNFWFNQEQNAYAKKLHMKFSNI